MKTSTEIAAAIRTDIRALGVPARAVGVRVSRYSLGATVYVTLRAALALPYLDAIQAIAKRHERVSRCPTTGEILCGGNVHTSVIAGPAYADQRALIELSAQVTAEMFPEVA